MRASVPNLYNHLSAMGLVTFRSLSNVMLTFLLASLLPSSEAAAVFFVLMLAAQVRGISELNLSNFCVLRLQDGIDIRKFSILLLLWQFLIVTLIFTTFAIFNLIILNSVALSVILFVICNQGIWGLVYSYGSADGNFIRHLIVHAILLASLVCGLYLSTESLNYLFLVFSILSMIYFLSVVHGYDVDQKRSILDVNEVVSYVKPFFLNSLSALFFALTTIPLVMKILSPDNYVVYVLVIQISSIYLFMYRGISKNVLASLYSRIKKNEAEEKLITLLLFIAVIFFLLPWFEISILSEILVSLGNLNLSAEFVLLASGLGLLTLINLHQNNSLQSINKTWPLLGFRVLSNGTLLVSFLLLYLLADEPLYKIVLGIDFLVALVIVLATRLYLSRYWKRAI